MKWGSTKNSRESEIGNGDSSVIESEFGNTKSSAKSAKKLVA